MKPKRYLFVLANETSEDADLSPAVSLPTLREHAEVLVIAPALNSRLRHWLSDEDDARRAAAQRLREFLERLAQHGVDATGQVGDPDPLQAIADALRLFDADEIVIATRPEQRSHRLVRNLVARARSRYPERTPAHSSELVTSTNGRR